MTCVRMNDYITIAKCVSESRILAERVDVQPTCVSERNNISKCVSERRRILAERVYITPKSVPERSIKAKCVSESTVLAERVYIHTKI